MAKKKIENRAHFTSDSIFEYFFVDTEKQLQDRTKHTVVFGKNYFSNDIIRFFTNGVSVNYQSDDSSVVGISIGMYLSISNFLKKRGIILNKKTCKLVKNT